MYPTIARRAGIQGTVECSIDVANGRIEGVSEITGHDLLIGDVKYVVRNWRYAADVSARLRIRIVFHLVDIGHEMTCSSKVILPYEVHVYARRIPANTYSSKR